MAEKNCSKCGESKPYSNFNKNKNTKDGFGAYCKKCNNLNSQIWRKQNKEKVLQDVLEWQRNNREKVSAKVQRWRENNPLRNALNNRNWKKNNLDKCIQYTRQRRSIKKQATPPWFEAEKVELVYKKAKEWGFHVDHVIPLQGKNVCGLHCWANLQLLDKSLNIKKGIKDYPDH